MMAANPGMNFMGPPGKESVELALEEQRTENQIEETMAARVNVLRPCPRCWQRS